MSWKYIFASTLSLPKKTTDLFDYVVPDYLQILVNEETLLVL